MLIKNKSTLIFKLNYNYYFIVGDLAILLLFIHLWILSKPALFGTRLVHFGLSLNELAYFLLGLDWIRFRLDLVGTEEWDDQNKCNGANEKAK